MNRRKIDSNKYLAAFAISTLIFFAGLFLGSYFSQQKMESLDALSQSLKMDTLGTELQYELVSLNPCQGVNSTKLADELYEIGSKLDFMESEMGTDNLQVLNLKEYYHLLEVRHWLFLKKVDLECGEPYDLVLYFYSNEGDCPKCDEQGSVLTYLHRKYPSLNIYSFDINIDNPALETIKEMYHIESAPTLVVNGHLIAGFNDRNSVEKVLFNSDIKNESETENETRMLA